MKSGLRLPKPLGSVYPSGNAWTDSCSHAQSLPVAGEVNSQVEAIRSQRALLTDPNPVPPLLNQVGAALRKAVSDAHRRLTEERDREVGELVASELWLKLKPEEATKILERYRLGPVSDLDIGTEQELAECLEKTGIEDWNVQLLALKTKVNQAREEAARVLTPKAVTVRPASATLNSREDVEVYVHALRERLLAQVDERPVIIP